MAPRYAGVAIEGAVRTLIVGRGENEKRAKERVQKHCEASRTAIEARAALLFPASWIECA